MENNNSYSLILFIVAVFILFICHLGAFLIKKISLRYALTGFCLFFMIVFASALLEEKYLREVLGARGWTPGSIRRLAILIVLFPVLILWLLMLLLVEEINRKRKKKP